MPKINLLRDKNAFWWLFNKKIAETETEFCTKLRVFVLHSMHQGASFELSKSTIQKSLEMQKKGGNLPKEERKKFLVSQY